MTTFTRTPEGQVAKYLFYREALLWVEGPTDIPFFAAALEGACRIECAGGKENCHAIVTALIESSLPYVVVIDGDYDILFRKRSAHRRLIHLRRYSSENYLCEKEALEAVCRMLARVGPGEPLCSDIDARISAISGSLKRLITLDAAHVFLKTGRRALPASAEEILNKTPSCEVSAQKIQDLEFRGSTGILPSHEHRMEDLVELYCSTRRPIDLLRGRICFGILRRLVIAGCCEKSGRGPQIDNDALRALLVTAVWSIRPRPRDHQALVRKLRASLRDAVQQRGVRP